MSDMQNILRKSLHLPILVISSLLLLGCSSGPNIITNSDPSADWTSFQTFGFFQPLDTDRGDVRSLMSNQLIESNPQDAVDTGTVRCRERLGGTLKFYYREAA